jgi:hypothetical protein
MLSVKFDGGLSILVLRNKQSFKKKVHIFKKFKFSNVQPPPFEERRDLGKRRNAADRTIRTEPACVS